MEMTENQIGDIIIDSAVNLHVNLGSGLLESVYEVILMKLLVKKGLSVQRQVSIPIKKITEAHKKQLLTYLKLTNTKLREILYYIAILQIIFPDYRICFHQIVGSLKLYK